MVGVSAIAVTVLGGYLGAGKTTLLNRILAGAPARTAVLVNDFGSVDLDTRLIDGADENGVVSLANGCICCTISDGLVSALQTIERFQPRPERLVIEASGVSMPGDIAVYASLPGFRLDSVVVVADAEQVRTQARDKFVGDVIVDQLAAADLLVLNKIDLVPDERVDDLVRWAQDRAPQAVVVRAERGELPLEVLLATGSGDRAGRPPSQHDAQSRFETWSVRPAGVVDAVRLDTAIAEIPASVARLKGIVRTTQDPDRRTIIHRVGMRADRHDGGPWTDDEAIIVAIAPVESALEADWLARWIEPLDGAGVGGAGVSGDGVSGDGE